MRPAAVLKRLSVLLALGIAATFTTSVVMADYASCVQACADQYQIDRQNCQNQLDATNAQLDAEAQACLDNNPTNPVAAALCIRNVNIKRFNARRDYDRCIAIANTVAYDCYRHCTPTGTTP
jgi:hypothetical protein